MEGARPQKRNTVGHLRNKMQRFTVIRERAKWRCSVHFVPLACSSVCPASFHGVGSPASSESSLLMLFVWLGDKSWMDWWCGYGYRYGYGWGLELGWGGLGLSRSQRRGTVVVDGVALKGTTKPRNYNSYRPPLRNPLAVLPSAEGCPTHVSAAENFTYQVSPRRNLEL